MTTELLLIRHGQSEANAGTSKEPDCPLTDLGREQARRMGERLAGFDLDGFVAVHSPYLRARQTAEVIAGLTGLRFSVEEGVREWGVTASVGDAHYPREPLGAVVKRLNDFLRRHEGRRLVVVTHAAPIAVLTHLAWGEPPATEGEFWTGIGNCGLRWVKSTCGPEADM